MSQKIVLPKIFEDMGIDPLGSFITYTYSEPTAEEKLAQFTDDEITAEYLRRSPLGKALE